MQCHHSMRSIRSRLARPSVCRALLVFAVFPVALAGCGSEEPREVSWGAAEAESGDVEADGSGAPVPDSYASDAGQDADPAAENSSPVINSVSFDPARPVTGDVVRVVVELSDADGDSPFLAYQWQLAGRDVGSSVPKLVLNGAEKGDQLEITVTASDGKSSPVSESYRTNIGNSPPALRKVDVEPGSTIVAGQPITLRPDARDADGDTIEFRYRWSVNGRRVAEKGPMLSTDELDRGDEVLAVVTASDGETDSEPLELPAFSIGNTPPRFTSWPGSPGADGVFDYQVEAEDPDGTRDLMFELEQAPEGMQIGARDGRVHWEPKADQIGSFSVSIVVDDLQGGRTRQVFELATQAPAGEATAPAAPE